VGTTLNSHAYLYDGAGQRTRQTRLGGNYVTNRYDIEGELIFANGYESGGIIKRYQEQFSYVYDAAGNLSSRTNDNLALNLTQDADNQLSTSTVSGTLTVAGNTTATATNVTVTSSLVTNVCSGLLYADGSFAARGLTYTNGSNTFTATASDSLGRTAANTLSVTLSTNASFTYDGNGNLTGDGRRVFVYDDENQLTGVTVSNVFQSIFVYDGRLRCRVVTNFVWTGGTRVIAGEIHYLYDGMTVVQERDGSNLPRVTYTRGNDLSGSLQGAGGIGGLLARTDHSTSVPTHAYYHADGNGNVTALINQQQVIVARYTYDPYGNLLAKSGPLADANTYRFSSKEWQPNAGLYYFGYRFYEPNLQRWVNRDPIGERGGLNLGRFSGNSPLNKYDPYGHFVGAVIVGSVLICSAAGFYYLYKFIRTSEAVNDARARDFENASNEKGWREPSNNEFPDVFNETREFVNDTASTMPNTFFTGPINTPEEDGNFNRPSQIGLLINIGQTIINDPPNLLPPIVNPLPSMPWLGPR
jgi:RHS repeat-associated protein